MSNLTEILSALRLGGVVMVPLFVLAVAALAVILEKAFLYWKYTRLPAPLLRLVETFGFSWSELETELAGLNPRHMFRRFFHTVADNRRHPAWWTESRAADEAQVIEHALSSRLWLLETVVTAAPLLGLMGTIVGMMHSFQLIGDQGLVNPTGVTGGVAQALIATALGLLIALVALFGFNYLSRLQAHTLDEMERLGTRLIDHIRLDQHNDGAPMPAQGDGAP